MTLFFIIFSYLALFFALHVLAQHLLRRLRNLPPTPFPSLPLIGHLYLLKKPLHKNLAQLSDKYGPVLFLQFGSRRVLTVASPSAVEDCLSKNDIIFANRPRLLAGKYMGYSYRSVAWAPYGDHWRNLRRISSIELLSTPRLQTLAHVRLAEVRASVRHIYQICSQNLEHKMEVRRMFFELVFNIMTRLIAGKRYYGKEVEISEEAQMFQEIVKETSSLIARSNTGDFIPILRRFMFTDLEKRFKALHEKRDKFMQNLIEGHRHNRSVGAAAGKKEKTMIEILLSLHETDPENYTDETIRSLMLVLLHAGSDTSVGTMEWAMTHLLDNPEVLRKAQTEIDNLVGAGRLIDEPDLVALPYLRSIITETTRMHPVLPLLLPHESSDECIVHGFRIPRGTMLLVNVWAIQNDPKIWVEPEKFMPERHQGHDGVKEGTFKFLTFGSGRRGCPGEALAMRVMGLSLGSLIQCFEWERPSATAREDMTVVDGITTHKAQPLMAICRPRTTMKSLLSQI